MTALRLVSALALLAAQEPEIHVDVQLVTVPCAVESAAGVPVPGLKADDFRVLDDGHPRSLSNVWHEADLPLTVALVADVSGSQVRYIASHREAIAQFLTQVIGPRDQALVAELASQTRLLCPLTHAREDLMAAVQKIGTPAGRSMPLLGPACRNESFPHSCGGTDLWHGLFYAASELRSVPGRKAIVILSDGLDTGSDISLKRLADEVETGGTLVYAIQYASPMRFLSVTGAIAQAASRGLGHLSHESGGLLFANPGRDPAAVFAKIENDLRNLYVLGFSPPADSRDGAIHRLEVSSLPGLSVRARSGYRAVR